MPQAGFDPPIIMLVSVYLNLTHCSDLSHHGWTKPGLFLLKNLTLFVNEIQVNVKNVDGKKIGAE